MAQKLNRRMDLRWSPPLVEHKWQARWEKDNLYHFDPNDTTREKWYELTMYPYPSGDLHIGHWYAIAPYDAHVRLQRMQGRNVLAPIGFDAFGLPAENAAIRHKIHPYSWTMANIDNMRRQLRSIGTAFDWSREIICCDPEYYRWNQWLFLELYKNGLAYRAHAPAVWCPSCSTTLANEQVVEGKCERCSTPITRRQLDQWFLRITQYAEELLDFTGLVDWPDRILTLQHNWIGRSEGAEVKFDISHLGLEAKELRVFTTRPDTLYGVTFLVLAPEHPLVPKLTAPENRIEVEAYMAEARRKSDIERLSTEREKTGVHLGNYCINPLNGEKVPILTADYAVAWYATGAVMGVPAHDQRDFEFAYSYNLPVRLVIAPPEYDGKPLTEAYTGEGIQVNSGPFNGLANDQAKAAITKDMEDKGAGGSTTVYRMRDWLISRQRYWGTPIPILYCKACGIVPVPEDQLPVRLPENAKFRPTGKSPLISHQDFINATCPECGGKATRETDTMDTFFDSSWYFLRYLNPKDETRPWDPELAKRMMPVDQYTGGAEHAVMHLLYARFFIKALRDIGKVEFDEPFLRLYSQGSLIADGAKMSKSKGNVVTPDSYVENLGADVVRCYLMFVGPWSHGGNWRDDGINGIARWLNRVYDLATRTIGPLPNKTNRSREIIRKLHQTVRKVNLDLEAFKFNTAIAALMELSNVMNTAFEERTVSREAWQDATKQLLLMLAPITPHIAEELWERTGHSYSVHTQPFPKWDDSLAAEEAITLVVQVDGRVRERLEVPVGISKEEAVRQAVEGPNVGRHLSGKKITNIVYVPGRLVNIVTNQR